MRQLLYLLHHSLRPGTGALSARWSTAVEQTRRTWRQEGYREIVLTGIEISSWGQDLKNGETLIDLTGGGLHRRTGCPHPAGEPGAPDHHRGVLPPGGRPAEPLPPVPLVAAKSGCDDTLRSG